MTELRRRKICLQGIGMFRSGAFFTGPVRSTNVSIPRHILSGEEFPRADFYSSLALFNILQRFGNGMKTALPRFLQL